MADSDGGDLAILDVLRLKGRRERGGLAVLDLARVMELPNGYAALPLALANLEKAELVVSALVDDGTEPIEAQRRLYYLSKRPRTKQIAWSNNS